MILLNLSVAVLSACMLAVWTKGHSLQCGNRQTVINGRCCDLCPPGTYVAAFCSDSHKTQCKPCQEGHFADKYNIFDRCDPCRSCLQEYAKKCTATTNTKCSCRRGFLCSNSICSLCEENKCVTGERSKKTADVTTDSGVINYIYRCEPIICQKKEYFDEKEDICKPWTKCNENGLVERLPGNITHNSVCERPAERHDGNFVHVILSIGLVLLSLTLLILLFNTLLKNLREHRAIKNPTVAVSANQEDFCLSKEESGHQLIKQDESKDSNSFGQLTLERVISS